jgi:hypothetical protein
MSALVDADLYNSVTRHRAFGQGIRGVIAKAGGATAAYMIVEPSTYYFGS